jgi:hypothetical protein
MWKGGGSIAADELAGMWKLSVMAQNYGGGWGELYNERLNNLCSSPNIVRTIWSRRMRQTRHVARITRMTNIYILADFAALPGYIMDVVNSLEAVCSFPFITSAINCFRRYIRGYGTVAYLSTIPHCWFPSDMSHVPVAWQRPGWNIHISSDISALWAKCHISPCLYSSLYLYNQVKEGNETISFTER